MTGRKRNGVLVVWPHGPHNFVLEDACEDEPGWLPGWVVLWGFVVEPENPQYRRPRSFYVRRTDYGYELMPANRDPIAIQKATWGRA